MSQNESLRQLTVRGFDQDLGRALRRLAREEEISLNRAALKLMRRGAGLESSAQERKIGSDLDEFVGVWSDGDLAEFEEVTRAFGKIDPDLWE